MRFFRKELVIFVWLAGIVALSTYASGAGAGNRSPQSTVATFEERDPIPAEIFIPRAGKRTACFITINSVEEKTTFTRYLDPAQWDVVELVAPAPNGSKNGWFDEACKKRISCDVNVISGHFAGRFFGDSGYSLSLAELEAHSCARDCDGILKSPKEVYLFGCNTLAGKNHDSRTPEQYYAVLRQDGFTHEAATLVVEDRYGPFGEDNRGKMQRAFAGVPYIYGFHSKGPLGRHIQPSLVRYFERLGDYTAHIARIEDEKRRAADRPNEILQSLLERSNFYQCSGLDANDPEYELHLKICRLSNRAIPLADRLDLVEEMLNSERVISLLPSIEHFVRKNIREIREGHDAKFGRLRANANGRDKLLRAVTTVQSPLTRAGWMRFAHVMGWITRGDLVANVRTLVSEAFRAQVFAPDMGDSICSLGVGDLAKMDFADTMADVQERHLRSDSAIRALGCVGAARYPRFKQLLRDSLAARGPVGSSTETYLLASVFSTLPAAGALGADDASLLERLKSQCARVPHPASRRLCPMALARLGAADPTVGPLLAAAVRNGNPTEQMNLAQSLAPYAANREPLETALVDAYLDRRHPLWYGLESYFMERPVQSETNRARLWDYLRTRTADGRRPDEMIYGLRDSPLSAEEVATLFDRSRRWPQPLITGRVFLGFLELGARARADSAFLSRLFRENQTVSFSTDADLAAFYRAMQDPHVQAFARANAAAVRPAVCAILRATAGKLAYDDLGDVVEREVPIRSCEEIL